MFRVLADGEERHLLEDAAGTPVGWIHGRVIGFRDLAGEAQALAAAAAAWQALETVLHREFGGRPGAPLAVDELRFRRDGASEWIAVGLRRIARVHRDGIGRAQAGAFAIELELPSYAHEGTAIVAAQVMGRAIRAHVDWCHGAEREAQHASSAATAARPPTSATATGTPARGTGVAAAVARA